MKFALLFAFICMIVVALAKPNPPGPPPPGGPPPGAPPKNFTSSFTHGAGFARKGAAPPSSTTLKAIS
ncbi:mediator of RNA polymerase II transcription subunit 19-like [Belonocnema kinseyi]|uniref:mediator of RNA polymerase II transcription subunit 19-like n=1 Tax=Belonocnema kinseyi TaxID=2817044 RepID=UPI00143D0981|nr:mediator of RNA polymerase II transcription subunit 19-like [Belonocnema kinseyi]